MKVRYVGDSDVRVINKSDWPDEFDHGKIEWSNEKGTVQEVDGPVAQWLIESHPQEFQKDEDEGPETGRKTGRR